MQGSRGHIAAAVFPVFCAADCLCCVLQSWPSGLCAADFLCCVLQPWFPVLCPAVGPLCVVRCMLALLCSAVSQNIPLGLLCVVNSNQCSLCCAAGQRGCCTVPGSAGAGQAAGHGSRRPAEDVITEGLPGATKTTKGMQHRQSHLRVAAATPAGSHCSSQLVWCHAICLLGW